MLRKFPESYPYLNSSGALITRQQVDRASRKLLAIIFNGEEKGLEISHALLYAITHLRPGTSLGALAYSVVPLMITWLNFDRNSMSHEDREIAHNEIRNVARSSFEDSVINKISLEKVISRDDQIDLFDMTKKQRSRAIAKLKDKYKAIKLIEEDEQ